MFSVVGFLRKAEGQSTDQFRQWWLESHVPKVLAMPGLLDYRLWVLEETLDQEALTFTADVPYDGLAVITFATKAAFEATIASPSGQADNKSFNEGAPNSLVLVGQPYVFLDGAMRASIPPGAGL